MNLHEYFDKTYLINLDLVGYVVKDGDSIVVYHTGLPFMCNRLYYITYEEFKRQIAKQGYNV